MLSPYEAHELIVEHVEEHAEDLGLGVPDAVKIPPDNDDDIPPGTYQRNENNIWVLVE